MGYEGDVSLFGEGKIGGVRLIAIMGFWYPSGAARTCVILNSKYLVCAVSFKLNLLVTSEDNSSSTKLVRLPADMRGRFAGMP
jgi:hypothetical protein